MMPPAPLKVRVLAATAREPAPPRRAVVRALAFEWTTAVAVTLGIFFTIGGPHAAERPVSFVAATLAGWVALALAATVGVARRGTMLGRSRTALILLSLALPVALIGWHCLWLSSWPGTFGPVPLARGVVCMVLTFSMGAVLFAAFARSRRDSDPVHPAATGAAAGAMAGAWASVLIDLHCDSAELLHVTIGHVLPVVLLAAVGAVLGGRVIRVRPDAS